MRAAGMRYYAGMVFGDLDEYTKVSKMPLSVMRDGTITSRDEAEAKKMLGQIAERLKAAKLSDDDRKQMVGNMIRIFDEATVQFIGANTAELTFLIRPGAKKEDGDSLGTFVVHRTGGEWKVVMEITDSAPVPPSYLLDVPRG